MRRKPFYVTLALVVAFCAAVGIDVAADGVGPSPKVPSAKASSSTTLRGIHRIKHVIVIMQENRSFDSYFGTYPGADGIPMKDGDADGVRADRVRTPVHRALPRPARHERGRPAPLRNARVDVDAREDERLRPRSSSTGSANCVADVQPGLHRRARGST